MWLIKNLKIINLWGESDFDIDFNLRLNILIGDNGIGKTTILRIINSALSIEPGYFRELTFDSVKLLLVNDNGQQKTLRIKKEIDEIHFYLSNRAIYQDDDNLEDYFFSNKEKKNQRLDYILRKKIRSQLGMPPIQWLPTNRIDLSCDGLENESALTRRMNLEWGVNDITNPIDLKLKSLIEKADEEISRINQIIVNEDVEFKNKMVTRNFEALNDSYGDNQATERFISVLEVLKNQGKTNDVFKKLEKMSAVISSTHVNLSGIHSIKNKLQGSTNDTDIRYTIDDVMKISAFSFLIQYVKDYDEYLNQIEVINEPLNKLNENFKNVFGDKFGIDTKNKCRFCKGQFMDKNFEFMNFSSGEKQMLIFIFECSLYLNNPAIYLTDEPEISLHLKWQKKYLDTLLSTNNKNQFFVATHSPDIIGKYRNSVIKLNELAGNTQYGRFN